MGHKKHDEKRAEKYAQPLYKKDEKHHEKHHGKHEKTIESKFRGGTVPLLVSGSPKKDKKRVDREAREYKRKQDKKAKRDSYSDTSSQKIQSGKKYTRLQRFPTNSPQQKKILDKFSEHVSPEHFEQPEMMKRALGFMDKAVQEGPPISPVEGSGISHLQNLLGRTPEEHLKDFEAPYMRRFNEEIAPGIAERYSGANAGRGSGFQNSIMHAGAGLTENLASLKGNLINQMLGQQTQAANVGLGYAQLPGQRYAQQMNAAQTALPASLMPQHAQQEMDRYAQNRQFQQRQAVLGQQPWGYMGVPPRGKQPNFWQGVLPRAAGALVGAGIGGLLGGPAGAMVGGSIGVAAGGGQPPAIQVGNMGSSGTQRMMGIPTNNLMS